MNVALGWGWFDDDVMCLRCVCPPCKPYHLFVQVSSVWITWRTTRTCTPAQRPWTSRSSPSRLRACSWLQPTSNNTAAETQLWTSLCPLSLTLVSPLAGTLGPAQVSTGGPTPPSSSTRTSALRRLDPGNTSPSTTR